MSDINLDEIWQQVVALISTWGMSVIGGIALLIIGRIVAGMVRAAMTRALRRARVDETLIPFITSLVFYLLIAFVVVAVLGLFGIPTASFIAVLGAAGLAVGLALQGTLSNFAAGVMLLIFRPFRTGDFVEVGSTTGTVQVIGVFSSILHTLDNVRVIVPNSAVYGQTIKNYSFNDQRRIDLVIGVSYDDNLNTVVGTIEKVLKSDSRVLDDPGPFIGVIELADSSVNLAVRPWVKREDFWQTKCDLTRKLKESLEEAGCSIPFPQRDVHMHTVSSAAE